MYYDSNLSNFSINELKEYKTHLEKTIEYLTTKTHYVTMINGLAINETQIIQNLKDLVFDIEQQINRQQDFIFSHQPLGNVFPLQQEIKTNPNRELQSEIDELKKDVKKLKKNDSKKNKIKRGKNKSIETVAGAVEDIMNVLSDDVLPFTDDLKHLHKKNKEEAKDVSDA